MDYSTWVYFVLINLTLFIQAEISTGQTTLSFSKLYFGGIEGGEIIPSTAPGLRGSMSQVYFNGQKFFELSRAGQLDARLKEKRDAKLGKFQKRIEVPLSLNNSIEWITILYFVNSSKFISQWWQITKKRYIMPFHSLQLTLSLGCLKWKLTRQSTSDFRFGRSSRMDFWCIMQVNFVFSRLNVQTEKIRI